MPAIRWTTRLRGRVCQPWTRPFCLFYEDRGLLPTESLERAFEHRAPYDPRPVWLNFRGLFRDIDEGSPRRTIGRSGGFGSGPLHLPPSAPHKKD